MTRVCVDYSLSVYDHPFVGRNAMHGLFHNFDCLHLKLAHLASYAATSDQAVAREMEVLARLAAATPCMGRVPDVHGYRQSRAVSGRRFRRFGSARRSSLDVTQARESARPLINGHDTVQPHARRRGHRVGARCCVRGVVVCVEIKFHGDGVHGG